MYLMIADEADQDGSKQFLIYAGVFFPADQTLKLHSGIEKLRAKYGYIDGDKLKSSPVTKPSQISKENHKNIKNGVLDLAAQLGCKICCYVVPHAIAKGQTHENRLKFGSNTLLIKFDQFLKENGATPGLAFFDNTKDYNQGAYLKEAFELGLIWSDGSRRKLERVIGIDNTGIGHSHLASVTDIVVGAFRFVANEPDKDKVGKVLLKSLEKIMWGKLGSDGELNVSERGICIRPQKIEHLPYRADIEAFKDRLVGYSKS